MKSAFPRRENPSRGRRTTTSSSDCGGKNAILLLALTAPWAALLAVALLKTEFLPASSSFMIWRLESILPAPSLSLPPPPPPPPPPRPSSSAGLPPKRRRRHVSPDRHHGNDMDENNNIWHVQGLTGLRQLLALLHDDLGRVCHRLQTRNLWLEFECSANVLAKLPDGTGSLLALLYSLRLVGRALRKTVVLSCVDTHDENNMTSILPWAMGTFRPIDKTTTLHNVADANIMFPPLMASKVCVPYQHPVPLQYMINDIQRDMHQLATTVQAAHQLDASDLDDVLVHFRCGDLFSTGHPHYGLLPFADYARHIPVNASRIGILTEPFTSGSSGGGNHLRQYGARCQNVVQALVDYLRHGPVRQRQRESIITVRNTGRDALLPVVYARLYFTPVVIAGASSFSIWPMLGNPSQDATPLATTGRPHQRRCYLLWPRPRGPNPWLRTAAVARQLPAHVTLYNATDWLPSTHIHEMWQRDNGTTLLAWLIRG